MNNNFINKDNYSAKLHLTADLIIKSFKKYNGISHMLTFSNFNETANNLYNILIEMVKDTDIRVFILSGDDSIRKRKDVIKEFYNCSNAIICSAKIFNEGVNIPIVDSICFTEDKGSEIDIVQCCGRPLRLYPNKKLAYIILPIIVKSEDSNIFEDKLDFDNIRMILKALGTIDERIIEELKNNVKENSIIIYETNDEKNVKQINNNIVILNDYISPIIYNRDGKSRWDLKLQRLQKFLENNDNKYPAKKFNNNEEKTLRNWIQNQRKYYNWNKLSQERINRLEQLPRWKWFRNDDEWLNMYNQYKEYLKSGKKNTICLNNWIKNNKKRYKKNELPERKMKLLNELQEFRTDIVKINVKWVKNYNILQNYINENNKYPECKTNKKLYLWVIDQKYKIKNNKLIEEQINLLEKLPNWNEKQTYKRKIERDEEIQNKRMKI